MILDFEKPIIELEKKITEMEEYARDSGLDLSDDIERLTRKAQLLQKEVYSKLSPWQRVQLARHPDRPYTLDYIKNMMTDFLELHGDRYFSDDPAIVAGLAMLDDQRIAVIGHQKGRDVKENLFRNFGMAHPEGYRKAQRIMHLAAKFHIPIISFLDTPGAYPGIGAEERGQAEAIAKNLLVMSSLPVPIIIAIIGEGASGGALGIGVGDTILMMENCWYSVISPEGCAAILWRDNAKAPQAAEVMKLTAPDLLELKIIDKIIREPHGGAHWDHQEAAKILKKHLLEEIQRLKKMEPQELVRKRIEKFSKMGYWTESPEMEIKTKSKKG
ncbi:MAG: acetyl-CoA carboxylase carboxyltransferase subunit alpha [Caldithrix sp. RBG_13_44_9]|nr:MAG: acetyl-CoA carboxylase carboxyltransferase subunit alpha [Caldithrix sp. RBG_13_44_9]